MDHFPTHWGRPRNDLVDNYNTYPLYAQPLSQTGDSFAEGVQRTQQPIVTGTSVLAMRYKDGVMIAADCLASYGSLARFRDVQRLHKVGDYSILGAGGDMSDFQQLQHMLDTLDIEERTAEDGHSLGPTEVYEYLSQVMYARRSKMNPLWNSLILAGRKNGQSFLGYVDLLGTTYTSATIATGYGSMIAQPLLRKAVEGREHLISEAEARQIILTSLKVLFYRDARSLNKFQIGVIDDAGGVRIGEAESVQTEWRFAESIRGYGADTL